MILRPEQTGPQGGDKQAERRLTAKVPLRAVANKGKPRKERELYGKGDVNDDRHSRGTQPFMTEKSKPGQPIEDLGSEDLEEARLRQQAIGVKLRHIFDEVVNEPVPDEFLDILRRADSRASGQGGE